MPLPLLPVTATSSPGRTVRSSRAGSAGPAGPAAPEPTGRERARPHRAAAQASGSSREWPAATVPAAGRPALRGPARVAAAGRAATTSVKASGTSTTTASQHPLEVAGAHGARPENQSGDDGRAAGQRAQGRRPRRRAGSPVHRVGPGALGVRSGSEPAVELPAHRQLGAVVEHLVRLRGDLVRPAVGHRVGPGGSQTRQRRGEDERHQQAAGQQLPRPTAPGHHEHHGSQHDDPGHRERLEPADQHVTDQLDVRAEPGHQVATPQPGDRGAVGPRQPPVELLAQSARAPRSATSCETSRSR